MTDDIEPFERSWKNATPGNQNDIYTLLAAWNTSMEAVLKRGDGSQYREVINDYLGGMTDLMDRAAMEEEQVDWAFLCDCVDAYPPGVGDHYCSSIIANVVGRCVIRTRIRDGVDEIPGWAVEYLGDITFDDDAGWAWESAGAFGWGVGHPDVDVVGRTLAHAEAGDESWAMRVLRHVTFADPNAGVDLLEDLLQSPETVEDLVMLRPIESALDQRFPDFPQYWNPAAELDYDGSIPEEEIERFLEVLGEIVHPDRLREFADSSAFDLERAAEEYGGSHSASNLRSG